MPSVTICIPAYRAGDFIAHTVRSALAQTFHDIVVELGVEPTDGREITACAPLLADPRLSVVVNDRVLGWAEHISAMLERVRTPYFLVLPHDDFLHERYVEILLHALQSREDAVVAYGDIQFMTGGFPERRQQTLSEAGVAERLISFLAAGAEAPPWRGVHRSSVLDMTFPTDKYQGLFVECEWAFAVLTRGVAVRVPRTLYFKRLFSGRRDTASEIRNRVPADTLSRGLDDHRDRLAAWAERALGSGRVPELLLDGLAAVVARRRVQFGLTAFDQGWHQQLMDAADRCAAIAAPSARKIRGNLLLVRSQLASAGGASKAALDLARAAVDADDGNPESHTQVAHLLRAAGDRFGALQAIARACDVSPYVSSRRGLAAQLETEFLDSLL